MEVDKGCLCLGSNLGSKRAQTVKLTPTFLCVCCGAGRTQSAGKGKQKFERVGSGLLAVAGKGQRGVQAKRVAHTPHEPVQHESDVRPLRL